MSSLVVKMLTVLVRTISTSQVFFAEKRWVAYSHFFSKNIYVYAIFNEQSFNDMLTKDIISFEQVDLDSVIWNYDIEAASNENLS